MNLKSWLQPLLGGTFAFRARSRPGKRWRARPWLEMLEDRLVPTAPTVQSIVRAVPVGPYANTTSVSYTVTFSEPVTGVNLSDFQTVLGGTVGAGKIQVTPVSSSVYTVTVNNVSSDGTLGLNVLTPNSVRDLAGEPLAEGTLNGFTPTNYVAGLDLSAVATADLNGDGYADIVTADAGNNDVAVFLNNKDGTFQTPVTIAAGKHPLALAIADVNGDGKPDLLVADSGTNSVGVLLGNGNGTFQSPASYAVGSDPDAIAVLDLNGDGKPDIAVANHDSNSVSVLLGNGKGTFQTQVTYVVGSQPISIAGGDLNQDKHPDLVVANFGSNTVSVLLSNGNGTFQAQSTFAVGTEPDTLALADLNGDGSLDLAVANYATSTTTQQSTVSLLFGNGNGTFQTQATIGVDSGAVGIAVADMNGDGKPDLIVDGTLMLGNGNGTFGGRKNIQSGGLMAVADFNHDGGLDLVSASPGGESIAVSLNASIYTGAVYTIQHSPPYVVSITPVTSPAITNAGSVSFYVNFSEAVTGVAAGDFSLSVTGTVSASVGQVAGSGAEYAVTVNNILGNGTVGLNLVDNGTIHDLAGNALTSSLPNRAFAVVPENNLGSYWRKAEVADVNGDGVPDIIGLQSIAGNLYLTLLLGNGNGTFQNPVSYLLNQSISDLAVANFDGNNERDIALGGIGYVEILLGNGNGTFQAPTTFATTVNIKNLVSADVNGDGKPDLLFDTWDGQSLVGVMLGNGNGSFQTPVTLTAGTNPAGLAVGDVSGDGKLDLVVANQGSNSLSVFLGNGNGTFQQQRTVATGAGPVAVAIAHVNADTKADLIVANSADNDVGVLLGNGNGTFQSQMTFMAGTMPSALVATDVNGDGKVDLLVADAGSNSVSLFLGNGDGTFQTQTTVPGGLDPSALAVGDLNQDGRPDLAVPDAGFPNGGLTILQNTGMFNANGNFAGQSYTIDHIPPKVVSIVASNPTTMLTNATSVTYTVTFSEAVTGVTPTDFQAIDGGTVAATVSALDPVSSSVYVVTVSGITGTGTLDLDVSVNGAIHDIARNSLSISTLANSFLSVPLLPGGSKPTAVLSNNVSGGDVRGDLFIADYGTNEVAHYALNGDGTYGNAGPIPAGTEPDGLASADFDGDGIPDLAIANYGSANVSVFLWRPAAESAYAVGADPSAIAVGDFNGHADIVTANFGSNSVSVLLGNGNGTFQSQTTYAVGTHPKAIAVGDVNGDGIPDIVVANYGSSSVSVLLGNGNGTFKKQLVLATGINPDALVLADVNDDGKTDLVVANYGSNSVSVLLGNGNGTFKGQATSAAGSYPAALAAADVNSDGNLDLVVADAGGNCLSTLLGNGNGTFKLGPTYATAAGPVALDLADINGDGGVDIITADENADKLNVLLATGILPGPVYTIDHTDPSVVSINGTSPPVGTTSASSVTYTVTFSEPVSGVAAADFKLALGGTVSAGIGAVSAVSPSTYTVVVKNISGNGPLGLNLFDNGAIHDLAGNPLTTLNAAVSFATATTSAVGTDPTSVAVADFNGDGIPDLVGTDKGSNQVSVLLGNGNGTYKAQRTYATQTGPTSVAVAGPYGLPVNSVGQLDLFVADEVSGRVSVLASNGDGTFQAGAGLTVQGQPDFILISDINDDGVRDLVVANNLGGVQVLLGDVFPGNETFATGSQTCSVAVADVNGDGTPDLIVANSKSQTITVLLGNGNGAFRSQLTFAAGNYPTALALADVNGDGKPDIIVTDASNDCLSVLLGNGNGTFQSAKTFATGNGPSSLAVADVNGDGVLDLVVTNAADNDVGILLGNGNGTFKPQVTFATGAGPSFVTVADLNGDGRPDLVLTNAGSNSVSTFLNAVNGSFTGQVYTIQQPTAPDILLPSVSSRPDVRTPSRLPDSIQSSAAFAPATTPRLTGAAASPEPGLLLLAGGRKPSGSLIDSPSANTGEPSGMSTTLASGFSLLPNEIALLSILADWRDEAELSARPGGEPWNWLDGLPAIGTTLRSIV